jgi:hypothetical protein
MLTDGSYQFSFLDRYECDNEIISLWALKDIIALKLIRKVLGERMAADIPKSYYHVKGHGRLKRAVANTYEAISKQHYVMRRDIKGYYDWHRQVNSKRGNGFGTVSALIRKRI